MKTPPTILSAFVKKIRHKHHLTQIDLAGVLKEDDEGYEFIYDPDYLDSEKSIFTHVAHAKSSGLPWLPLSLIHGKTLESLHRR